MVVDFKDISRLAFQMKEMHRAVLPNAVRFTINDLSFDVKKSQMLPAIKRINGFDVREPNFFKKFSGVEKAKGYDIHTMVAEVGMMPSLASNAETKNAIERQKQQDIGGNVQREHIPLYNSRSSGKRSKKVQNANFWKNITVWRTVPAGDGKGLIQAVTSTGIQSDGMAKGKHSGFGVIYGDILYGIQGFKRLTVRDAVMGGNFGAEKDTIKLHLTPLYNVKEHRIIKLYPHKFMQNASNISWSKLQEVFTFNAEKQIAKFAKR